MGRNKSNQSNEESMLDSVLIETSDSSSLDEVKMTGRAIGTAINPSTGTWVAAVIEFNPATGQARVSRTLPSGNSKTEAAEKFKILAVEEGVVV